MKKLTFTLVLISLVGLVVTFQNCGTGPDFSAAKVSQLSSTSNSGNSNLSSSLVPAVGCYQISQSGKSSTSTGSNQASCLAGCQISQAQNTSDPLICYFNGQQLSLVGPTPSPTPTVSTNVGCYEKFSNGGIASSKDATQSTCAANCALNASQNPGVTIACYFNGSAISFTTPVQVNANGIPTVGCYEKFSSGGVASTKDATLAMCTDNCALNASQNPGVTIACYYNGNPVSFSAPTATNSNGIPSVGCYEKFSNGGVASTKDGTQQNCKDNCSLNRGNNPTITIACYFNGSQI